MKLFILLASVALSGCVTIISGDYVPPSTGPIAYLTIDNTQIASPTRSLRIIAMTSSGCVGSPFITTDKFQTTPNVYRVAIPAGEKIVVEHSERIDQRNGWTNWSGSVGFEAEAGVEYSFHSYVKMPNAEMMHTNKAPEIMIKTTEKQAEKNPEGQAAMIGIFKKVGNKDVWVKPLSKELPPEKSYGFCPKKS